MWPIDRLTRFEVARVVGARALQIALGAPVLVKVPKGMKFDPIELAKLEFKQKVVPITVRRPLPTGEYVTIDIKKAIDNWLKEYGDL
ncbi:MAG: DNA-directed RNA polymerase subunit K [Candidatus Aenigmarchaeota archaeon]|nr:DNA-directed RNA polymerase subunit K [Candidatus Aenigmarchaeota archaeon]